MIGTVPLVVASARSTVADYVDALFTVYLILIFAYIVVNIAFAVGVRPPYTRWTGPVLDFLRQVVEPYLAIFRRFLPTVGPFDLSPMVATFVLIIVWRLVVAMIHG